VGVALAISNLSGSPWLLVASGLAVSAIPLGRVLRGHQFDPFEPIYLFTVSYLLLFVLRPAVELAQPGGPQSIVGRSPETGYTAALLVGLIGASAFHLGYLSSYGRVLARRIPLPPIELSANRLTIYSFAVTCCSVALYGSFLGLNGGADALGILLSGRNTESESLFAQPAGYLYSGLFWLASLGTLILAAAKTLWSRASLLALGLVVLSQIPSLASGARSWTLPVAAAVLILLYLRRSSRPSLAAILVAAPLVFTFGVTLPREQRVTATREESLIVAIGNALTDTQGAFQAFVLGADTAMVPDLAIAITAIPETVPFQLGATYVEAMTRPIPRAFWPDKPKAADTQLMEALWPTLAALNVGFSFSGFGEPYLNFGYPGVAVLAAAFGLAWRALYEWLRRAPNNPFVQGLFALSWPFLFVYMRGGLGVDYQRQVIAVLPFAIGLLVAGRSTHWPEQARQSAPPTPTL
jgi:hypothetical protein